MLKQIMLRVGNAIWKTLEFLFFKVCYSFAAIPYRLIILMNSSAAKETEKQRVIFSIVGFQLLVLSLLFAVLLL